MEGRKGEKNREWKMVPLLLPIHLFIFILFVKEMGGILSSSVALGVDDRVVFVRIPKTGSSSFVNWFFFFSFSFFLGGGGNEREKKEKKKKRKKEIKIKIK